MKKFLVAALSIALVAAGFLVVPVPKLHVHAQTQSVQGQYNRCFNSTAAAATPVNCYSASAGTVQDTASAQTVIVNTSALTPHSQIIITPDASVTVSAACAAQTGVSYVSARNTLSFTITTSQTAAANFCWNWEIVNSPLDSTGSY